jgi:uncharacterized protein (TIGR02646 family)
MIRVDRTRVPTPAVVSTTRANEERRRAGKFFAALLERLEAAAARPDVAKKQGVFTKRTAKRNATGKQANAVKPTERKREKFNFSIYRDDEIKVHLNQLFHGKCAYCEMRYAATQPMDVEHFRPKAEATDFDGSTCIGYYWLASDWTNLLPSCIDCNRARLHLQEPGGKEIRLGKETLFPIAPGSRRAAVGEPLENERPLLLDPCRDDPELYLTFPEGWVVAAAGSAHPPDVTARANASVRVYGLNRMELVQERRRVLLTIRRHFDQIRLLALALADATRDKKASRRAPIALMIDNLLTFEMETVLAMTEPNAPFSLMAKQEVAAFEAELERGL